VTNGFCQLRDRDRLQSRDVKAFPACLRTPTAANQRLGHVVDVNGMEPYWVSSNRSEEPTLDRPKEAKQVKIARTVDQSRTHDYRRESAILGAAHEEFRLSLGLLVGIGWPEGRLLVGPLIAGDP
jgi:hypothetical protein